MMTIDDNNNNNIVNSKVSCTQYLPLLWVSELRIEHKQRITTLKCNDNEQWLNWKWKKKNRNKKGTGINVCICTNY